MKSKKAIERKTNVRGALILLILFSSTVLRAQDTVYFSLEEALDYAVENNLNAENARIDVAIADQRVWEATATGLPQLNASVNYNYNINLATTLIPDFLGDPTDKIEVQFGTKHFATAGLVGSQLIFSGEFIIGLQASRIFREFTQRNKERTEQEVRQAVMQNYYLVLLGENTLDALLGNLENVRSSYEETRELLKAGFVEEIDADQLEVTVTALQNSVLSMERQLVATKNLLKYQMGLNREKAILLTDSLPDLVQQIDFESSLNATFNLEENIDYQILSEQERLAMMDLKLKKTEYLPTLSAFYSLDYTAQRDEFNFLDGNENWFEASAVGLSLNIPIFSSGLRRAGLAQKKLAFEQAQNNKVFASEGLEVEFQQAKYDFANAMEQFRAERRNLELSEKVVSVTQQKYNEGVATSLELTQVNDQYINTLGDYTTAMVEVLNAKIRIDLLMNKI
jgi:outer membrane protein TolC